MDCHRCMRSCLDTLFRIFSSPTPNSTIKYAQNNPLVVTSHLSQSLSRQSRKGLWARYTHSTARGRNEGASLRTSANRYPDPTVRGTDKAFVSSTGRQFDSKSSTAREQWRIQKEALARKFEGEHWQPLKRLSPDTMDGIRALNAQHPDRFTTPVLAHHFEVSPESIRRILRSKWRPSDAEHDEQLKRWEERGQKIWAKFVELGVKPPQKWRKMGVGKAPLGHRPKWKKMNNGNKREQPIALKPSAGSRMVQDGSVNQLSLNTGSLGERIL